MRTRNNTKQHGTGRNREGVNNGVNIAVNIPEAHRVFTRFG